MASWESVAHALGKRMYHHAYCGDHKTRYEGCPFCDDRAAYELYIAKIDQYCAQLDRRMRKSATSGR